MELSYFRDKLFDLLNESDELNLADLDTDAHNRLFIAKTQDGDVFEILCRQASSPSSYDSL